MNARGAHMFTPGLIYFSIGKYGLLSREFSVIIKQNMDAMRSLNQFERRKEYVWREKLSCV